MKRSRSDSTICPCSRRAPVPDNTPPGAGASHGRLARAAAVSGYRAADRTRATGRDSASVELLQPTGTIRPQKLLLKGLPNWYATKEDSSSGPPPAQGPGFLTVRQPPDPLPHGVGATQIRPSAIQTGTIIMPTFSPSSRGITTRVCPSIRAVARSVNLHDVVLDPGPAA